MPSRESFILKMREISFSFIVGYSKKNLEPNFLSIEYNATGQAASCTVDFIPNYRRRAQRKPTEKEFPYT